MAGYSTTEKQKKNTNENDFDLRDGMSEIKKDAKAVREDLDTLKADATQMTTHATQEAIEAVRVGAQSAGEMAKSVGDSMKQTHGALCDKVSERPTASILLALGVGVVAGRILAARR